MEQKVQHPLADELKLLKQKCVVKGCHVDLQKELLKKSIDDIKKLLKDTGEYVGGQYLRKNGVLASGLYDLEDQDEARRIWIKRMKNKSHSEGSLENLIAKKFDKKCDYTNTLNNLRHKKKTLKLKMDHLKQCYHLLEIADCREEKIRLAIRGKKTDGQVENDIDKAKLKYQMTRQITHKFHDIIFMLSDEASLYNSRLDKLEEEVMNIRAEIKKFNGRKLEAQEMEADMKAKQAEEDEKIKMMYKARDIELTSTRNELEEKTRQLNLYMRDILKLLTDTESPSHVKKAHTQRQDLWKTELMARRLKEKMRVKSLEDVIHQFTVQNSVSAKATAEIERAKNENETLRSTLKENKKEFEDLKYSAVKETPMVEKMKTQLEQAELKLSEMKEDEKSHGDLFIRLQLAINNMVNMLAPVELQSERIGDEIFDKFDWCLKKIEKLLKGDSKKRIDAHISEFDLKQRLYYNYIEEAIPKEAKPILTKMELERSSDFLTAISLNIQDPEMLTREQIKDTNAKLQAIKNIQEGNKQA